MSVKLVNHASCSLISSRAFMLIDLKVSVNHTMSLLKVQYTSAMQIYTNVGITLVITLVTNKAYRHLTQQQHSHPDRHTQCTSAGFWRPALWSPPLQAFAAGAGSPPHQSDLKRDRDTAQAVQISSERQWNKLFRHGRTVIVAVHAVEHEPQPLLMSLQVLGELIEVQQAVVVDVALKDDLRRGIEVAGLVGSGRGVKRGCR